MTVFNDRRVVMRLINIENKIQVDDNMDDIAQNLHRRTVLADMMLPGWYDGWESVYDNIEIQFQSFSDNHHQMKEIYVATDGDVAFILMHLHLEYFHGDTPQVFAFRQFDTFQLVGERWLCKLGHCMVPVVPDTGLREMGALDVRPEWKWPNDTLPGPSADIETAQQEVRTWFDRRITATSADDVMALLGPREDIISYTPYSPEEHRGQAEIRQYYEQYFAGVTRIDATVEDYHVTNNGLMAAILARVTYRIERSDGSDDLFTVRQSHGLRRVGDCWEAMIEMASFPIDFSVNKPVKALV